MINYYNLGDTQIEVADNILNIKEHILQHHPLPTSTWQSQDGTKHPEMQPIEMANALVSFRIPQAVDGLQELIQPNLPWAEDHFQERISGIPHNPPPSSSWWPYARVDNEEHKSNRIFSHTYPERIWPKWVNSGNSTFKAREGLRYQLGDLSDVINLLAKDLYTRQAYLPIWFPEDTGAIENQRVPCTLGYHFRVRPYGKYLALHVNYFMRSCDIMRHMVDDLYMAARLAQHVTQALTIPGLPSLYVGELTAFFSSLHLFVGDVPIVKAQVKEWNRTGGVGFSHAYK